LQKEEPDYREMQMDKLEINLLLLYLKAMLEWSCLWWTFVWAGP